MIFKINDGTPLSPEEIDFILEKNAYELLGEYYEKNIAIDKWHIVKAASYYRKAGLIDKALSLTSVEKCNQFTKDKDANRFLAAILTNKGACFRDKGNLDEAEKYARDAIKNHSSFYPYNLLGAIYIERGKIKEGDDYFQKAECLGAIKKENILKQQISFLKLVVEKAPKELKVKIAEYFYTKDSVQYSFLRPHIRQSYPH